MQMECRKGYYAVLGVSFGSSDDEIRRAYRDLAMQWHPDKWSRTPSLLGQAKEKFQQVQEAYSVLSDRTKRTLYDAGLYEEDNDDDEVEGFTDFLQEMVSLVNDVRKEKKTYSNEELQSIFGTWHKVMRFLCMIPSVSCQQIHVKKTWFEEMSNKRCPNTTAASDDLNRSF